MSGHWPPLELQVALADRFFGGEVEIGDVWDGWIQNSNRGTAGEACDWWLDRLGVDADELVDVHWPADPAAVEVDLFERLQAGLCDALSVSPAEADLQTPLKQIFPKSTRREQWQQLEQTLGWGLPRLLPSAWFLVATILVCLGIDYAIWIPAAQMTDRIESLWLSIPLGLTITVLGLFGMGAAFAAPFYIAERWFPALQIEFNDVKTAGDLLVHVPDDLQREVEQRLATRRRMTVWDVVRETIAEVYGEPIGNITSSTLI